MVVGTANKNFGTDGTVVVKNQKTNVPPTKTVTGDTDKTVSVGDTLSYTIEGTVPSTTGLGADYTYVFKDYASAGLSIDTAKTNVKVYAGDAETELDAAEYTVDPAGQTVTGDGTNVTFSVTLTKAALDKLQNVAGQKLVVKYDATVTEDAKTNPVTNSAEVVNGGNSSGQGTPVELYSNKFDFTKVFADGSKEGLTGAVFTVTDEAGKVVATASPDADGKVSFSGLKNGTYTVTETTVATGAQNVTGKFTVKLTYNETTKKTDAEYTVNNVTLDPYDLVKQDDKGAVTVTNVKSITQLPLTGAAGTALFTVIGLLLAGAAATVALKSRETKRALRA
ncbi:SpaH/EbpB family LPXTG-anchored major pilin [Bifidobacterium scardovii]|nr:SpaH/EbpB family LPXTG-anchored major pilin [Bifidobacterium scardovii]